MCRYPCGSLKGDARSKTLVEAWRDNALFLKSQYKVCLSSLISRQRANSSFDHLRSLQSTLDKGMAKSIYDQKVHSRRHE